MLLLRLNTAADHRKVNMEAVNLRDNSEAHLHNKAVLPTTSAHTSVS